MATRRRALRLILALQAWRLEHGQLPESLDPLVGSYPDQMPLDPSTGQPFGYYPDGLKETTIYLDSNGDETDKQLKARTPFVWSLAEPYHRSTMRYVTDKKHPLAERRVTEYIKYLSSRPGHYSKQAQSIGWPFPIPAPEEQ